MRHESFSRMAGVAMACRISPRNDLDTQDEKGLVSGFIYSRVPGGGGFVFTLLKIARC